MTTTTIQRPGALHEARRFLAATAERVRQEDDLLSYPVDRAVINAVLGTSGALLGDRRGGERLAAASEQLRHHVQHGQAHHQDAAVAHTLLAILYTLHPDPDLLGHRHLKDARDLIEADDALTGGDALVLCALTGLAYALLATRD
ncbi:hypothetical protein AB0F17_64885 [Nonomuraea sp. NPDC026600]|uniref:hypothetical protein n=1 Tax=Nonomuraea sp. NPDC026600 TaxID=3155363 RepID=UPI0034090BDA